MADVRTSSHNLISRLQLGRLLYNNRNMFALILDIQSKAIEDMPEGVGVISATKVFQDWMIISFDKQTTEQNLNLLNRIKGNEALEKLLRNLIHSNLTNDVFNQQINDFLSEHGELYEFFQKNWKALNTLVSRWVTFTMRVYKQLAQIKELLVSAMGIAHPSTKFPFRHWFATQPDSVNDALKVLSTYGAEEKTREAVLRALWERFFIKMHEGKLTYQDLLTIIMDSHELFWLIVQRLDVLSTLSQQWQDSRQKRSEVHAHSLNPGAKWNHYRAERKKNRNNYLRAHCASLFVQALDDKNINQALQLAELLTPAEAKKLNTPESSSNLQRILTDILKNQTHATFDVLNLCAYFHNTERLGVALVDIDVIFKLTTAYVAKLYNLRCWSTLINFYDRLVHGNDYLSPLINSCTDQNYNSKLFIYAYLAADQLIELIDPKDISDGEIEALGNFIICGLRTMQEDNKSMFESLLNHIRKRLNANDFHQMLRYISGTLQQLYNPSRLLFFAELVINIIDIEKISNSDIEVLGIFMVYGMHTISEDDKSMMENLIKHIISLLKTNDFHRLLHYTSDILLELYSPKLLLTLGELVEPYLKKTSDSEIVPIEPADVDQYEDKASQLSPSRGFRCG